MLRRCELNVERRQATHQLRCVSNAPAGPGTLDFFEADLDRQLCQDALDNERAALARADEAEEQVHMLQRLLSRVMQDNPSNQSPEMSAAIEAMLRRPATADLEALAEALDKCNEATAATAVAASASAEVPKQAPVAAEVPPQAEVAKHALQLAPVATEVPPQAEVPKQALHDAPVAPEVPPQAEVPKQAPQHAPVAPEVPPQAEVPKQAMPVATEVPQGIAEVPKQALPVVTEVSHGIAEVPKQAPVAAEVPYDAAKAPQHKSSKLSAPAPELKFGYVTREGMAALFGPKCPASSVATAATTPAAPKAAATPAATTAPAQNQATAGIGIHPEAAATPATPKSSAAEAPAATTAPTQNHATAAIHPEAASTATSHNKEAHAAYMRYYRSIRPSAIYHSEPQLV